MIRKRGSFFTAVYVDLTTTTKSGTDTGWHSCRCCGSLTPSRSATYCYPSAITTILIPMKYYCNNTSNNNNNIHIITLIKAISKLCFPAHVEVGTCMASLVFPEKVSAVTHNISSQHYKHYKLSAPARVLHIVWLNSNRSKHDCKSRHMDSILAKHDVAPAALLRQTSDDTVDTMSQVSAATSPPAGPLAGTLSLFFDTWPDRSSTTSAINSWRRP